MMCMGAVLTTVCVTRLISCGQHHGMFSYPAVVERTLGRYARYSVDFLISATQFSFMVSQAVFLTDVLRNTFN